MKNKIFLIIYLILAMALAYWVYPVIKNRYFNPDTEEEAQKLNQNQPDSYEIDLEKIEEDEDIDDDEEGKENETDEFLEITNEDCENNCAEFEEEKDARYCRQICGLVPPGETIENNCADLIGLEKDYCLKDLAIIHKDFKICQEIKDINIKKTCQNRITEEILSEN